MQQRPGNKTYVYINILLKWRGMQNRISILRFWAIDRDVCVFGCHPGIRRVTRRVVYKHKTSKSNTGYLQVSVVS